MPDQIDVVVAGHICLDLIPSIPRQAGGLSEMFVPGKLINVGGAVTSTGGAVSNTGLALHQLGIRTSLMAKTGDDPFGDIIRDLVQERDPLLATGMIVDDEVASSYTVVINPPGTDRVFLHCPGANDAFRAEDVKMDTVSHAGLFHFGYPPLMQSMFVDGGKQAARMLSSVQECGVTTSLDMAKPDPDAPAGKVDWCAWLEKVLPYVDVFLPSIEEMIYMLDPQWYKQLADEAGGEDEILRVIDTGVLDRVAVRLLEMGAGVVCLKLGELGFYIRSTDDVQRIRNCGALGPQPPDAWAGRELLFPCLQAEVVGTTGAGDCTIAGFLSGLVKRETPEQAGWTAVAVGACNTEAADATGGVPTWEELTVRLNRGWAPRTERVSLTDGWRENEKGCYSGPRDKVNLNYG